MWYLAVSIVSLESAGVLICLWYMVYGLEYWHHMFTTIRVVPEQKHGYIPQDVRWMNHVYLWIGWTGPLNLACNPVFPLQANLDFITSRSGCLIGCCLGGQRSKSEKVEKGFTVITPPHYEVSLPFQQGQTFVLADLASKGHGRGSVAVMWPWSNCGDSG